MELIFPLLILFMIGLVFMSSRQRKKQERQQQSLQHSLSVGDVVVMTSGISGTVVDVDDERTIDLEIAPDVVTTWLRAAVREKLVPDDTGVVEHTEDVEEVVPPPASPAVAPSVSPASAPTETAPVVDAGANGSPRAKSDTTVDKDDTVANPATGSTGNVSSPRSS